MKKQRRHLHNLNGGYVGSDQTDLQAESGMWSIGPTNIPKLTYTKAVVRDEPFVYFRLDETSSSDPVEDEVSSNVGSYVGGVTVNQSPLINSVGENGTSVLFNGSTGRVDFGNLETDALTVKSIEAWIKPNSLAGDQIIFKEGGSGNGFGMGFIDSQLRVGVTDSSVAININYSLSNLSVGQIYHIVGILDRPANTMKIYVNNNLVVQNTSIAFSTHDGNCEAGIGSAWCPTGGNNQNPLTATNTAAYFNGTIDEVAIYNFELSTDQISKHYAKGGSPNAQLSFGQMSVLGLEDEWAINPAISGSSLGRATGFSKELNND